MKKWTERKEALFRILVLIVSGIILAVWNILVRVLIIVNFVYTLIKNKRHKGMAELCEWWNTEAYKFFRYITFVSNIRPFPFTDVERLSKYK
jgi:hypothetical protein